MNRDVCRLQEGLLVNLAIHLERICVVTLSVVPI